MARTLHLEGKDWFTESEAAEYCGVALSTFREGYRSLGIVPRRFMGKKLYSRADLFAAIDKSPAWDLRLRSSGHVEVAVWQRLPITPTMEELDPDLARRLSTIRQRPYKARKKTTSE